MEEPRLFQGFSKLSEREKARLIAELFNEQEAFLADIESHRHPDSSLQKIYQELSENTLTNYFLPFSVAPNFLINDRIYHIPMVIEESSVVAAAAAAAGFWSRRGGFITRVENTLKRGQIHFLSGESHDDLKGLLAGQEAILFDAVGEITRSMERRGGGLKEITLVTKKDILPDYHQLDLRFDTVDSMGANFINSVLETVAGKWDEILTGQGYGCEILMSILSNYTPDCLVSCYVETPVEELEDAASNYSGEEFARRFVQAVKIAGEDVPRAVTHNKGIFNGMDAVVMATGNDYRAVEANGHAWAARKGRYGSLSRATLAEGKFRFELSLPLALGTVGGITRIHPLAKRALEMLGWPTAPELMQIVAAAGLANNFSAVRALISKGIQAGHMKLHLSNILTQLNATSLEREAIREQFRDRTVSYRVIRQSLERLRQENHDQ